MAWIIATIWPATDTKEKLIALHKNWVRILRLNCSHAFFLLLEKSKKNLAIVLLFFLILKVLGLGLEI